MSPARRRPRRAAKQAPRPPPTPAPAPPTPSAAPLPPPRAALAHADLLRKYRELLTKHEAALRKLDARNREHLSTFRLSAWAMERSASALALVGEGAVLVANPRWHALAREGEWHRVGPGGPEDAPLTLREAAHAEARTLPLEAASTRVVRYQRRDRQRTLELRVERLAHDRIQGPAVLVLAHDVTEQVRAEEELERARERLAEQEHLHALGEMAAGLAHDLNNTLDAMRLRLELIQRDASFSVRQQPSLDALVRIVSDASLRVQRLQAFSRQEPTPEGAEEVHLADLVRDALEVLVGDIEQRAASEGLTVRIESRVPRLPPVRGPAVELRYVLINLLLNARDAMPRGGTIRVRGARRDDAVVLTVEDEGTGIPEEHLRSVFRPFFSTKGPKGTGLGLSMAYGVMARLGGSISAANRPEGGAVLTLTFPVRGPASPSPGSRLPSRPRSPERSPEPRPPGAPDAPAGPAPRPRRRAPRSAGR